MEDVTALTPPELAERGFVDRTSRHTNVLNCEVLINPRLRMQVWHNYGDSRDGYSLILNDPNDCESGAVIVESSTLEALLPVIDGLASTLMLLKDAVLYDEDGDLVYEYPPVEGSKNTKWNPFPEPVYTEVRKERPTMIHLCIFCDKCERHCKCSLTSFVKHNRFAQDCPDWSLEDKCDPGNEPH